jgi:hypothetical protein
VRIVVALLLAGCTLPPLRTPTPSPPPSPTATATSTPTPIPATPVPTPTPVAAIPTFTAAELVATALDGLRVRQRPGIGSVVVTGLLPRAATLEVVMGPIVTEAMSWYLVRDADSQEPQFDEGWVAAGFEPEPFLRSTGATRPGSPSVASLAQTGNAEYGPITIDEQQDYDIRWVALDPDGVRCQFAVLLAVGAGAPVPAIRATIGNGLVPGTLQPNSFAALAVQGEVFVSVASDCAWTLVVERVPEATPGPSPSSAP